MSYFYQKRPYYEPMYPHHLTYRHPGNAYHNISHKRARMTYNRRIKTSKVIPISNVFFLKGSPGEESTLIKNLIYPGCMMSIRFSTNKNNISISILNNYRKVFKGKLDFSIDATALDSITIQDISDEPNQLILAKVDEKDNQNADDKEKTEEGKKVEVEIEVEIKAEIKTEIEDEVEGKVDDKKDAENKTTDVNVIKDEKTDQNAKKLGENVKKTSETAAKESNAEKPNPTEAKKEGAPEAPAVENVEKPAENAAEEKQPKDPKQSAEAKNDADESQNKKNNEKQKNQKNQKQPQQKEKPHEQKLYRSRLILTLKGKPTVNSKDEEVLQASELESAQVIVFEFKEKKPMQHLQPDQLMTRITNGVHYKEYKKNVWEKDGKNILQDLLKPLIDESRKKENGLSETIFCALCKKKLQRFQLISHGEETCPKRTVNCGYCSLPLAADAQKAHRLNNCVSAPVGCPNGCSVKMARSELVKHTEECANKKGPCDLAEVGCAEKVTPRMMEKHLQQNSAMHMKLLMKRIRAMELRLGDKGGFFMEDESAAEGPVL